MSTTKNRTNRQMVYNAVRCMDCNKLIESTFRHDYKTCGCPNQAMVDGGLAYQKYGGVNLSRVQPIAVYDDEPFSLVRKTAWRANQKGEIVRLCDMSSDWLDKAIDYELTLKVNPDWHLTLMIKEKQYRIEKEIFIEDKAIKGKDYITPKAYTEALEKDPPKKGYQRAEVYSEDIGFTGLPAQGE